MHAESIKLLLADESETMCKVIRAFLNTEPRIEVIGEARTLARTIEMAGTLHPNVILLDLHMPAGDKALDTLTVRPRLLACSQSVIAISLANDKETEALANEYGAVTLLDKLNLAHELIPTALKHTTAPPVSRG